MKKNFLFIIFILSSLFGSAQKPESYSSFYNGPKGPFHKILLEYRPGVFNKKSLEKFQQSLKEKCGSRNVTVNFAEMSSDADDSLRRESEFVCRISSSNFKAPMSEVMLIPIIEGPGLKDRKSLSILGFADIYSGTPDWKCFCSLKAFEIDRYDPANCLFDQWVSDGIIQ